MLNTGLVTETGVVQALSLLMSGACMSDLANSHSTDTLVGNLIIIGSDYQIVMHVCVVQNVG